MSREQPPHDATELRWIAGELCSVACTPVDSEKVYQLRIDTPGGRERVFLSRARRGLRLDVATGRPVSVGPVIECDLGAMELPICGRCDRCAGPLRRWCVVDRFPQIRAVVDPGDRVAIAVHQHELAAGHAGGRLRQRPSEAVQICTECGHEQPVTHPTPMV